MTFETFEQLIPKINKMSLPGETAHFAMAPELRIREVKTLKLSDRNPRHAAVMMLLYPKNKETHIALILRPEYEGVHSGQIALPGGKVEKDDASYKDAALRETQEEIGVPSNHIDIIKPLTRVYIPPSNFWVHPFLGTCQTAPLFTRQEEEVAAIIEVPITQLLNEANIVATKLTTSYAVNMEVPSFNLKGYTVWGATAMMLSELKSCIKEVKEL